MAEILTTNGMTVLVDDEDLPIVSTRNWFAAKRGTNTYIQGHDRCPITGKWRTIKLHRLLLQPPSHLHVDHINGNALDNRRANLRVATSSQNNANRHRLTSNKSGFRGVSFNKSHNKWAGWIRKEGANYFLGYFANPEDAARSYDRASLELFGEYGLRNFPDAIA